MFLIPLELIREPTVICRNEYLFNWPVISSLEVQVPYSKIPSLYLPAHACTHTQSSSQVGLHIYMYTLALSQTDLMIWKLVFWELALPQYSNWTSRDTWTYVPSKIVCSLLLSLNLNRNGLSSQIPANSVTQCLLFFTRDVTTFFFSAVSVIYPFLVHPVTGSCSISSLCERGKCSGISSGSLPVRISRIQFPSPG